MITFILLLILAVLLFGSSAVLGGIGAVAGFIVLAVAFITLLTILSIALGVHPFTIIGWFLLISFFANFMSYFIEWYEKNSVSLRKN